MQAEQEEMNLDISEEVVEETVVETVEEPTEAVETTELVDNSVDSSETKVQFDDKQQEKVNEIVNKHVYKTREAERKNIELETRLSALEKEKAPETRPDVPAAPDPYAKDYAKQVETRDKAITEAASFDARERLQEEQAFGQQQQKQQEVAQAVQTAVKGYSDRADKMGITKEALAEAGGKVAEFNLPHSTIARILDLEHGAGATLHLARNPQALYDLSQMNAEDAAVYIATDLKAAAAGHVKQVKKPPAAVDTLSGKGASDSGGLKGVTYE